LFLGSAISTGVAAIALVDRRLRLDVSEGAIHRFEELDSWAIVLELSIDGTKEVPNPFEST
jgi:hypothetical protein